MLPQDFTISTRAADQQIDKIHAYLTRSYWATGISLELVRRCVENSLCFGLFHAGEQVGLARVVTDRSTFAYLCDVYVLEAYRGRGLGKTLVQAVLKHPDLQGLRRFMLATRDAHGLYAQYGFLPAANPKALMEIVKRGLYLQPAGAGSCSTTPNAAPQQQPGSASTRVES